MLQTWRRVGVLLARSGRRLRHKKEPQANYALGFGRLLPQSGFWAGRRVSGIGCRPIHRRRKGSRRRGVALLSPMPKGKRALCCLPTARGSRTTGRGLKSRGLRPASATLEAPHRTCVPAGMRSRGDMSRPLLIKGSGRILPMYPLCSMRACAAAASLRAVVRNEAKRPPHE